MNRVTVVTRSIKERQYIEILSSSTPRMNARLCCIASSIPLDLQVRTVKALAALIESNLLSADKRFLQPSSDLYGLDRVLELQRNRCVVQARGCELVGLLDEARLETTPVIGGYLPGNTSLRVVVDEVLLGVKVDCELALRTDDLSHIFLAVCHHARSVVVGDPAVPELDNTDGVVVVLVLLETWENGDNTVCGDGLGYYIGAEVPEC
jgi:hypothetical protein